VSRGSPSELLLDTHALLWWLAEPDRLSPAAHAAIAEPANQVHVSAASGWEIATKVRLGKLPAVSELLHDLPQLLAAQGFALLPINLLHGLHAGGYPMAHRDPFDRLLAAQAVLGRLTLVSLDPALDAFPCCVYW
jgi:PIN domain nuclease of toxin-antitoxin system